VLSVREFLLKLQADIIAEVSKLPPGEASGSPGCKNVLSMSVNHMLILLEEEAKAPNARHRGLVRASWERVKVAGLSRSLFDAYRGDERLRRELLEFLNSGQDQPWMTQCPRPGALA
jgi:hypothetical protein